MFSNQESKKRGRPHGIPQSSRWGTGVKTTTVRVPVDIAPKVQDIITSRSDLQLICEIWERRIEEATEQAGGETPPRYWFAKELLFEVKLYLFE